MKRFLSSASAIVLRNLLLTILIAGPTLAGAAGNGNGIEVHSPSILTGRTNRPTIELFINKPRHDAPAGTYQKNAVPLEYRVEWGVCGNKPLGTVWVVGRFAQNGGKLSTLNDANTTWNIVHFKKYSPRNVPCSGETYCNSTNYFNGTVDLSSLSAEACNTTLQLVGWRPMELIVTYRDLNDLISLSNRSFYNPHANNVWIKSSAHAVNLWLNFLCPVADTADVSFIKTGPASVLRPATISYTVTASNAGPGVATNVAVADVIPAGLTFNAGASSGDCAPNGAQTAIQRNTLNLNLGESRTFTLAFNAPAVQNCTQTSVTNTATVSTSSTDANLSNNTSQASTTLLCPSIPALGCIDIVKETFAPNNSSITPVPQFTFHLDDGRTVKNDSNGHARIENVSVGQHTVS